MTQRKQGGFTLIELMIVVAIIGILAAVALPQYQDYVARSQASESAALAGSAKTAIAEYHQINGSYPTDSTSPSLTDLTATGTYGELTASAEGVLLYTFGSNVASTVSGKKVRFAPDIDDNTFKWTCTTDLAQEHAPQNCTGGATIN
ncbi:MULTISPECIES: pilin [unclassified Pseudoalteromonas]|uniref:pilin n=1 Tax=unclassified Pseudoalteromonas TaxID=194690 RepID=UPI0030143673